MKSERTSSRLKFVGLHAHDGIGSPFDGMGEPKEHMDFCWQNGMDAMALTNHGSMLSFPFQYFHAQEMNKRGKKFKPIFGMEAYYIDSLEQWRIDCEIAKEDKKNKKELEKSESGIVFEEEERGLTGRVRGNSHFLLLAKNQVGLYNLFKLVSQSNNPNKDYFFRKPRIDFELLRQHSEGLIATTTCISGVFAKIVWENPETPKEQLKTLMRPWLFKFLELFGENNFFGELQWNNIPQQHILNQCIIELCQEVGIPMVSTVDSHYPTPESWEARELLKRLAWLSRTKRPEWIDKPIPKSVNEIGYELYPKNGDQMFSDYKKYSRQCGFEYDDEVVKQSIENTYWIAHELIENVEPKTQVSLPDFVRTNPVITEDDELKELCFVGLKRINKQDDIQYINRLNEELEIIKERGFSKYFLAVNKIIERAKREMFIGCCRGSSGGSLVAYILDIVKTDPIEWGLLFSRFLPKDSTSFPDIDMDFSDNDKMKKILIDEWGKENVIPITNINKMKVKSLLKDVCKFYEIPFAEINPVTRSMDDETISKAKEKNNIDAGAYTPTWDEYLQFSESLQVFLQNYPNVAKLIPALLGEVRSIGTHAAGLVIRDNVCDNMPLIRKTDKKTKQTFWQTPFTEGQAHRHLEPLGFLKFDILGLESLAMMEDCIRQILINHHNIKKPTFKQIQNWYNNNLSIDILNHNDIEVYKNIFHKGKFLGTFQFTGTMAQEFAKTIQPLSINDGAIITSTVRPGPLSGRVHEILEHNKNNPNQIEYLHPIHKKILEPTYGCLIYQEQIAELIHEFGDVSLDDGNEFRKLLTKKGLSEFKLQKLEWFKDKFLSGAVQKGLNQKDAQKLYDNMVAFAQYGFCKSHAIGYFFISFQTAWLSHYYEPEWACAVLNHEPEKTKEEAIALVKSLGYKIVNVNVNKSQKGWSVVAPKTISQPLSSIKGIGDKAVEEIVLKRPFDTLNDFLFSENMDYRKVNKKVVSALCLSGALDEFMTDEFNNRKHFFLSLTEDKPSTKEELEENIETHKETRDFSKEERIEQLVELTGQYPYHLVISDKTLNILQKLDNPTPQISQSKEEDCDGIVWFIVREVQKKKTKNDKPFLLLKVVDDLGGNEVIKVWGEDKMDLVELNRPIMAQVEYSDKRGFSIRNLKKSIRYLN